MRPADDSLASIASRPTCPDFDRPSTRIAKICLVRLAGSGWPAAMSSGSFSRLDCVDWHRLRRDRARRLRVASRAGSRRWLARMERARPSKRPADAISPNDTGRPRLSRTRSRVSPIPHFVSALVTHVRGVAADAEEAGAPILAREMLHRSAQPHRARTRARSRWRAAPARAHRPNARRSRRRRRPAARCRRPWSRGRRARARRRANPSARSRGALARQLSESAQPVRHGARRRHGARPRRRTGHVAPGADDRRRRAQGIRRCHSHMDGRRSAPPARMDPRVAEVLGNLADLCAKVGLRCCRVRRIHSGAGPHEAPRCVCRCSRDS